MLKKTLRKREEIEGIKEVLVPEIELVGEDGKVREELRLHKRRERDSKFVADYKEKHRNIEKCPACKITIEEVYKIQAIKLLELHHILPLSKRKTKVNSKLKEKDVILLCPSCHRVIHKLMSVRQKDKITLEEFISYLT